MLLLGILNLKWFNVQLNGEKFKTFGAQFTKGSNLSV